MKSIRPSWRNYILLFVSSAFLAVLYLILPENDEAKGFIGGLALLFLVMPVYYRYSNLFTYSEKKIESKKGLISRKISTIRLKDLRSVKLSQGIVGRLLNVGVVEFSSAGESGIEVTFKGIFAPAEIKDEIENLMDTIP